MKDRVHPQNIFHNNHFIQITSEKVNVGDKIQFYFKVQFTE